MSMRTYWTLVFLEWWIMLYIVLGTGTAQQCLVQAQVGHTVNIPCLVPLPNITQWQTLRLYLQKSGPSAVLTTVFAYANGREQPDLQEQSYRNRTHLCKDNVTLSLSHVSPWDEGQYDCHIFLLKKHGHELVYSSQLLLSVWAEFSQPQITVLRDKMGAENTAMCSSQGGHPKGYVHWNLSPHVTDSRNETWAEYHPQTQLYKISGQLTLNTTSRVSISCCVVARERKVCSKSIIISPPEGSRAGRPRRAERTTTLLCLTVLLSLTR